MRKVAWAFIILLIHVTSYCWSAPTVELTHPDQGHYKFENVAMSAAMEMTLPQGTFTFEDSDSSKQDAITFSVTNDALITRVTDHQNFIFSQSSSPRLYLRIKVFRN